MTKIDLDELERKARAANVGCAWRIDAGNPALVETESGCAIAETDPGWASELHIAHAEHIAANSPTVTLALIARILELESELTLACDRIDAFHECYTKVGRDPLGLAVRGILEKGAVFP